MTIEEYLTKHEGERLKPYSDAEGNITIGVGHNLTSMGITFAASMFILQEDIRIHEGELQNIFPRTWDSFSDNAKMAFIDMHFHFGDGSFRRNLSEAIVKADMGDWKGVVQAVINCPNGYYKKFPARAKDNINLLGGE